MNSIGYMPMPSDFKYKEAFLAGRPRHARTDRFRIRHPAMDCGKRAKIFAPFDALKGFGDAIDESVRSASLYDTCVRSAEDPEISSPPPQEPTAQGRSYPRFSQPRRQ